MKFETPRFLGIALFLATIVGCEPTAYKKIDGNWCYVTIDTGRGRQARKLPVDHASFVVLPGGNYAKDAKHVFFNGFVVEKADPSTFLALPSQRYSLTCYGKDKSRVFLRRLEIRGADPSTFQVIEGPYSRDAQRNYCGCVPMQVEDRATFEVVHWDGIVETGDELLVASFGAEFSQVQGNVYVTQGWSRDGKNYYYGPAAVRGRDYSTIQVIDTWDAQDKDGRFSGDLQIRNKESRMCQEG